jgi:hypothetical protein
MSFSDEILMAYADGELEPALAARVEQAMLADPQVAAAVQRHRALRTDVFAAFAGVLDEPVPERLRPASERRRAADAAAPSRAVPGATVVKLDAVRAVRERAAALRRAWPQWGALAASLVIGVLAGAFGWQGLHTDQGEAPFGHLDGALVAQGQLADALSRGLARAPSGGDAVKLGISFQARDGSYCRSFMLGDTGGLACRDGGRWRVPVLAEGEPEQRGAYRQAGSAMPAAVLDAIDQRIAGAALDAQGERAARDRGWQR